MEYIFPGFVCRVAGLPEKNFQKMRAVRTSTTINKLIEYNSLIAEKKNTLSDLIYQCISATDEQEKRNALLKLKRKIFNLKKVDISALKSLTSEKIAREYEELGRFLRKKKEILVELNKSYNKELNEIRTEFKNLIANQDFQKGLLISSKILFDSQQSYINSGNKNLTRKQEQIERGLLRYYSRMVMKATPFGTFCSITPGQIKNLESNGFSPFSFTSNPSIKESMMLINKELYPAILTHITKNQQIKKTLRLELNQTISIDENIYVYLTAIQEKEIFQRLEKNEVLELFVDELNKHKAITFENLIELVCGLEELEATEEEAEHYIDRLIEIGFLRFKIGIPEQKVDWVEPLCDILKDINDEHAKKLYSLLTQLVKSIDLYKYSTVEERSKLLDEMDILLKENFEEMKIETNLKANLPFYEDASSDSTFVLPDYYCRELTDKMSDFIFLTRKIAYPRTDHISMRHFFDTHYIDEFEEVPLLKFYEDYYKEHYKEHLEKQQKIQAGYKDEELKNYNVSNPFNLEVIKKIQDAHTGLRNLLIQKWIDNPDSDELNISKKEIENEIIDVPNLPAGSISASIFSQIVVPSDKNNSRVIMPGGKYLLGFGKYFSRFLRLLSEEIQEQLFIMGL